MARRPGLSFVGVLLACGLFSHASSGASDFVVLCNQSNPLPSLSRSDLRKAFTGGIKQWPSGAVIHVGLIASNAPETEYLADLIGMTSRELMRRIQEQVFKGEMKRPALLRSSADCAAFARSTEGAICTAVAMPAPPDTRVVPIR